MSSGNWPLDSLLKTAGRFPGKSTKWLCCEAAARGCCVPTHEVGGNPLSHARVSGFQACVGRKVTPLSSHVLFVSIFKLEILTAGINNQEFLFFVGWIIWICCGHFICLLATFCLECAKEACNSGKPCENSF